MSPATVQGTVPDRTLLSLPRVIAFALLTFSIASGADESKSLQPFFKEYCIGCHGEEKQKGDVRLDDLSTFNPELWGKVYEQLAGGEMPPDNKPQPAEAARRELMADALERAGEGASVLATGFRRLNKREYSNTVRDLLGLRKGTFDPGEYIYDDEIDEGFDTGAESLVISNELLLEYMGAAEKSLRHALFSPNPEKPVAKTIEVNPKRMKGTSGRYINNHNDYLICRSGGKAKLYDGEKNRTMTVPGRYTFTVTASAVDRDRYPVRFTPEKGPVIMGFGIMPDGMESLSGDGVLQKTWELKDDVEETIQFDTWIDKSHFPYFSFVNGSSKPITQIRSNIRRRKLPSTAMSDPFVGPGIRISQFRIEGPFHDEWPPQSFRATYDAEKIPNLKDETARKQLVQRFATRAFRRPVAVEEISPYLDFLGKQHAATNDWHESIIRTFAAMMASLDFLYLHEGQGELESHTLANRLSYFLWSTMPDRELFSLADSGKIKEPMVLKEQVNRMLNDPRSDRFAQSFADQWLSLDTLGSMPPDGKNGFRAYYQDKLDTAMLAETRQFFSYILQENRGVLDFIDSDYSFVNRGLANLYGIPFGGGDEFVRVTFPPDSKRGGLLGQGSILTLTSNGVETSPVVRGHWVLDELLGTPPPPAPKEVPALVPDLNGLVTVRQQLEKHRSDSSCAECHRLMDPLGFALEAYDPIGRLRSEYSKTQPVTTFGSYKGQDFTDPGELKKILATELHPFARNLVIRIAEYAKGRKLGVADYRFGEKILENSKADKYPLRDMVVQIATGPLLRNR